MHAAYEPVPLDAPMLPEVLLGLEQDPQTHLELATEGVLRYLWQSRWGPMLIEVKDGRSYVNDQAVEPFGEHDTRGKMQRAAPATGRAVRSGDVLLRKNHR